MIIQPIIRPIVQSVVQGMFGASAGVTTDFVFTIETSTTPQTFTIPCQNVGTFNANIEWGDGEADSTITTYNDADLAHSYATPGTYQIRISGTFPNIYFNNAGDKLLLRSVDNLGVVGWTRLNGAFAGCTGMTSFTAGNTNTSAVTNVSTMFLNCSGMIVPPDVTGMDTSLVAAMESTFQGMTAMTAPPDVTGFNTALVTNMAYVFNGCAGLTTPPDVSGFNTIEVTTVEGMFRNLAGVTSGSVAISGWNIAALTTANNFMYLSNTALSDAEYDATLTAWSAQTVKPNVAIHFGSVLYTAAAERAILAGAPNNWVISGDAPA